MKIREFVPNFLEFNKIEIQEERWIRKNLLGNQMKYLTV